MTLYFIAAVLLFAFLAVLTIRGERKDADLTKLGRLNLRLGIAGAVLLVLSFALGCVLILTGNPAVRDWAWDAYRGFYLLTVPLTAAFLLLLLLSCLTSKHGADRHRSFGHRLRILLSLAASAILLMIAPLNAVLTSNTALRFGLPICLSGLGESLILRFIILLDYRMRD